MCKAWDDMARESMERGEDLKVIEMVCKKLKKGKDAERIAEELEEEYGKISSICDVAVKFAPEYDCSKIYGAWKVS